MSFTALKAMVAAVPALLVFAGSAVLFSKTRAAPALLQLLGAGCLLVVVLAHICEMLDLIPWMRWGLPIVSGTILISQAPLLALRCSRSACFGTR